MVFCCHLPPLQLNLLFYFCASIDASGAAHCAHVTSETARNLYLNNMQNLNFTVADLLHIFADEVRKITRAEIQAALIAAKNEPKKMYSRTEACKVLHVTVPTLWRWEKEGLIKGQRAGRRVLFSTEEINRLIHEKGGNV